MATLVNLRAKIKSELSGISNLQAVHDYHEPNIKGYPAVTFDVSDEASEFLTNKENLEVVTYQIVIYQEIAVAGLNEAKRILDNTADAIKDVFRNNYNLDGVVDYCTPLIGTRGQFENPSGTIMFQQMTLNCYFTKLTT